MTIEIKTEGLEGFNRAIREYEKVSSKTREEVLEHRARNFAFALFREFQKRGRLTKKKIQRIPASKMKVRGASGRSQRQEKARRIFASGFVATGWIPAIKALRQKGSLTVMAQVASPQGSIYRAYKRGFVELINSTPGAAEADAKHNLTGKAFRNQEKDMRKYLADRANRDIDKTWGRR